MDLYAQNIIDHYRNPRNSGKLLNPAAVRREANYSCGDIVEVDLGIAKDTITEFRFRGEGCVISRAASSILGEHIRGKTFDDVLVLTLKDVKRLLKVDVTQRRLKCALLGLLAVQNAILAVQKRPVRRWHDMLGEGVED